MAVFNIPDIYGRFYLVNFDNVKVISLAEIKHVAIYFLNLMTAHEW